MNAKAKQLSENVVMADNPMALLQRAVDANVDVEKLERLMQLHREWKSDKAKEAYYRDLSEFQSRCPPIKKTKEVENKPAKVKSGELPRVRYRYAPLDEIVKTARPLLKELGFSFDWQVESAEGGRNVVCLLNHIEGHQGRSSFFIPNITGFGTNAAQDEGSASTYGRRYSLCNVLGLVVDEDDDGAGAAPMNAEVLVYHNSIARDWLQSILAVKDALAGEEYDAAAEVMAEMPRKVQLTLWRAPRDGGFWTTEERTMMKESEEFKGALHKYRKDAGWYDQEENQA